MFDSQRDYDGWRKIISEKIINSKLKIKTSQLRNDSILILLNNFHYKILNCKKKILTKYSIIVFNVLYVLHVK